MAENASKQSDPYTPSEMMGDLREGLFAGRDDLYRRNLQRAYVDQLGRALYNPTDGSDLPALARVELEAIAKMMRSGSRGSAIDRAHRADLAARVERALDPEAAAALAGNARGFTEEDFRLLHEVPHGEHDCRF